MKKLKLYQVDAFTDKLFSGNPAAVCILDSWPAEELMQSIAMENNLAETAFLVPIGADFEIRWFTPAIEVDLCGHATLASAFVLFHLLNYPGTIIRFNSHRSGILTVERKKEMLYLDFPTDDLKQLPEEENAALARSIGITPTESYKGKTDFMVVVQDESALNNLVPDYIEIAKLKARGLIVTAKGDSVDFVSRFFAPQSGIDEDPVTGSAHTTLLPYWSAKLGKTKLTARQISQRTGYLECEFKGERCIIGGQARLYLTGEINVN